jgi:predicted signal transduction protein with EAL and GGDEF domain
MDFSSTFSDNFPVKTNSIRTNTACRFKSLWYVWPSTSQTWSYSSVQTTDHSSLESSTTRITERSYYKAMLIYTIIIFLVFIYCLIYFPSYKCTKMKYNSYCLIDFFLASPTTVNKIISKNSRLLSFTIIVICFTINTTNWYIFIRTNHWTFSIRSQCNITERLNDKFMYTLLWYKSTLSYYNDSIFHSI